LRRRRVRQFLRVHCKPMGIPKNKYISEQGLSDRAIRLIFRHNNAVDDSCVSINSYAHTLEMPGDRGRTRFVLPQVIDLLLLANTARRKDMNEIVRKNSCHDIGIILVDQPFFFDLTQCVNLLCLRCCRLRKGAGRIREKQKSTQPKEKNNGTSCKPVHHTHLGHTHFAARAQDEFLIAEM
jgi:hypothetical protein